MLWALCAILLILSPLGLFVGYTMGGVIHALLAITIIVLVIRLIERRRVAVAIETLVGEGEASGKEVLSRSPKNVTKLTISSEEKAS